MAGVDAVYEAAFQRAGIERIFQVEDMFDCAELLARQQAVPGWLRQIPGSLGRVAFLLIALVLAQVLFPIANVIAMTLGVAVVYAMPFLRRLWHQYSQRR